MQTMRAGVIGAGVFGGYHASKYAAHDGVALVGVCDPDATRAGALAQKHDARAFADPDMLFAMVDMVTIASPALTHGALAVRALEAGLHVLVEKPLAASVEEAEAAVALSERAGLVLQVGHQERFVFAAMGLLDVVERPRTITARRMGPFSERGADVSVSLDLMTHDVDLVRLLAGRAPVTAVNARGVRSKSQTTDHIAAAITFDNGVTARLEASRLAEARDRVMRVEYASGAVEVDFIAKTFVNESEHDLNPDFMEDPSARDSLGAGVHAFIDAAAGRAPAMVSGADGLEAVRIALQAEASAAEAGADIPTA